MRQFNPLRTRRRRRALTLALISLVIYVAQQSGWLNQAAQQTQHAQPGLYTVTEINDGDTIRVNMNDTEETVRMIGVDTPETRDPRKAVQCFGRAAATYTTELLRDKRVRLEADPQSTNRDRYNRLLRYVYTSAGQLINAEIIKQGYGFAYTSFPFSKADEFKRYELAAREGNKGLWKDCRPEVDDRGFIRTNPAQ